VGRRTILMYHRVADAPFDPYSLCVTPGNFAEQLEAIKKSADVVALEGLDGRTSRPQIALTFDDGYADVFQTAMPLVEAAGVPFTVFVVSGMLDHTIGFWWDRLALMLRGRDEVEVDLEIDDRPLRISLRGGRAGATALVALHSRLRVLPLATIEATLTAIASQLDVSIPEAELARTMTSDELRILSENSLATIGAHTVDHMLVAGHSLSEQVDTMSQSKRNLEALIAAPVRHFAYPYGDGDAFDSLSVKAAQQCGFSTASTALAGRVTRLNHRLRLPRRMVLNWSFEEMAARLSAWRAV